MANDNLRAALQQAGLTPDDLAQIVEVDIRTVRRWLSGRNPYPRQRGKVARALDTTQTDLWPQIATAASRRSSATPTDLLAAYPVASDPAAPDWQALIRDATDQIDLLGDTLTPILSTPGVPDLLATKATNGSRVRILVYDTGRHLVPFLDQPGIEIRVLDVPAHYTIHRYDEQLLLTLNLLGEDADQTPLLQLRRAAPGGLFDRLADHCNDLWEQASQPIKRELHLAVDDDEEDEDENTESEARLPTAGQPGPGGIAPSAPSPRRWPRRPT